jgi:hypothetical protein
MKYWTLPAKEIVRYPYVIDTPRTAHHSTCCDSRAARPGVDSPRRKRNRSGDHDRRVVLQKRGGISHEGQGGGAPFRCAPTSRGYQELTSRPTPGFAGSPAAPMAGPIATSCAWPRTSASPAGRKGRVFLHKFRATYCTELQRNGVNSRYCGASIDANSSLALSSRISSRAPTAVTRILR